MIFYQKKFNSQIVALIHPMKKIKVKSWKMFLNIKLVLFIIFYALSYSTSATKVPIPRRKRVKIVLKYKSTIIQFMKK